MIIQYIKNSFNKTITRKLIIGISAVHALLMSIFVFDLVDREKTFLVAQHKSQTQSLVKILAINASSGLLSNDLVALEEIIMAQQEYPNIDYSMIVDLNNKVLAYSNKDKVGLFLSDDVSQQLLTSPAKSMILLDNERHIDAAFPIMSNKIHIGWARVGLSKNSILNNLTLVTQRGVFYSILAIIVGVIFAWFMAKGLISNILNTSQYLKDFEEGKRQINIEDNRTDELGQLNKSIKRMFNTLTEQEMSLKQNHQLLEIEVKNRTQELEQANKKLQSYSHTIEKDKIELESAYEKLIQFQKELVEQEKFSQLGQLISGVSHEMNTPLGIAITSSSIIKDKMEELITKIECKSLSKQYLSDSLYGINEANGILESNIQRCVTLISAFKKISTDINIKEIRTIKALDYINDIFQTVSVLLKQENIHLTVQGYNSEISIEPSLLAQVITNLVTNSIAHAFINKEEPKKITVIITEQNSWVTIEYKDNGCGMSSDILEHVFEPFYTTKRSSGGTGLGMNIVYNLVRKNMAGNITINSVLGEGTSVFIQLPK